MRQRGLEGGRGRSGRRLLLALAAAGGLTSLLLELVHYRAYADPDADSLCRLGASLDCGAVALSGESVVLGIPLPIWGVAGFVAMGLAAWQRSRWLLPLSGLAVIAGVVLSGLSVWSLGVGCLMCELVHAISIAIAVVAWRHRRSLAQPLAAPEASALTLLPAAGLLLAAAAFLPPYWAVFTWKSELPFAHGRTEEGDPWIGAEHPTLTLQEFVDYSCPHCKIASSRSLERLAEHAGTLRIVRRHLPSSRCRLDAKIGCLPLRVALCAGDQQRFWHADRWLFQHAGGGQPLDVMAAARDLGLDAARLSECVESDATFERAHAEWKRAKKARVPGTPYYRSEDRSMTISAALELIDAL